MTNWQRNNDRKAAETFYLWENKSIGVYLLKLRKDGYKLVLSYTKTNTFLR